MKAPMKNFVLLFFLGLFLIGCSSRTVIREEPLRNESPKEEKTASKKTEKTDHSSLNMGGTDAERKTKRIGAMQTKELVMDGYTWDKRSELWKAGFIAGWMWGGAKLRYFPLVLHDSENKLSERVRLWPKWKRLAEGFLKEAGLEIHDIPFIQISRMIDNVYSDPRVKHWDIVDIMPLVRGRLKEGWTEKDLDEVIAYYIKYNERMKMFEAWDEEVAKLSPGSAEREETNKKYEKALSVMPRPKTPNVLLLLEAYKYEEN